MQRSSWLTILVSVFLVVPMLRYCCVIPVEVHPSHCHESGHTNNESCYLNQDAAVVNKNTPDLSQLDHGLAISNVTDSVYFQSAGPAASVGASAGAPTRTPYLRSAALRI